MIEIDFTTLPFATFVILVSAKRLAVVYAAHAPLFVC